jgi:hypothetical protein
MTSKTLMSTALVAALITFFSLAASAQNKPTPKATIGQQGLVKGTGGNHVVPPGYVPAYCSPCLFYGGDGDPNNANADGLWDNNSADFGIDAQVYSPFSVAKVKGCGGKCAWGVTGMFANIEMYPNPPIAPTDAAWAIYSGLVAGGTPASSTTVCSGTDSSPVLTDTGRLYFGFYEEYTVAVSASGCPSIKSTKAGTEYWEQVTPEFGATGTFQLAYESNVPDTPAPNALGTEPVDQSYFYGPAFGVSSFTNTTSQGPFHTFSAGVEGTLVKGK